ncbi:MAG: Gfo/Idh/MocA family oxidoreductase [Paludibacter sp.]|jgi:predicted dehydrogenase|nr:Gfo/Idh/MocA family oxidoreductase [Paludibacter sp.]
MENTNTPQSEGRREALKTLATVPVIGAMAYGVYKKRQKENYNKIAGNLFNVDPAPVAERKSVDGEVIRIGIIGYGSRGSYLMRSLGFATPELLEEWKKISKEDPNNTRYQDFLEQEDLKVEVRGVCDIFTVNSHNAVLAGSNLYRQTTGGKMANAPVVYETYRELLAAPDIDAVIIATPDHWHGTMIIEAAQAGKHVYVEKPLTWTVQETYLVEEAVKNSNIVFQLGHQGRQIEINHKAKAIIEQGLIGKVTLVEVSTNRNDPNGAWVYPIHPEASPKTIDWSQYVGDPRRIDEYHQYMKSNKLERYIGPDEREKFSLERFFRWRCWWDYSTGLSGDLLTHEYDVMNHMLNLGIPHSATSSGGVYYYKDGRTVPDVLQTSFEFPHRDMTMLYSATLASEFNRPRKIMGTDATIELGSTLDVIVDRASKQYKDKIDQGIIKPGEPFYRYASGKSLDALSSATEMYFAQRGLLYSYVQGKKYDTTYLHLREWIDAIRNGSEVSCGIQPAFEEAITAHMGTRAYLEGRTMYWDKEKREIIRG